ncbi:MAG: hypothetical protein Q8S11_02865 [Daejeonella sp.]|uniref:hypothetical protein n=1 Tax=Daejeonella sp. TaxID=2805397 RepID=UPI0027323BA4|nr:hypothetical protein [Daejeonella sp.]MDP3467248.1 hypothetical protein [Daejeonella sp.]
MEIFIIIIIFLAIFYLIFRKRKKQLVSTFEIIERPYRRLAEGDRTLEEIMFSKPSNEVLAELSSKKREDLTGNELLVLSELTKWYDENPSYKGS